MEKKIWKKQIRNVLLHILLLVTVICTLDIQTLAQEKTTLACMVETAEPEKAGTLKVKIVLEGANEIASGQTVLLYDEDKVKISNIKKGNMLTDENIAMADVNTQSPGEIKITFLCAVDKWVSEGEVAIAEFEQVQGSANDIEFVLSETELSNTDFEILDINLQNGKLSEQRNSKEKEQRYDSENALNDEEAFSEGETRKNDSVNSKRERNLEDDLVTLSEKNEVKTDEKLEKNILFGILGIVFLMILVGIVYVRKKQR